jgi:hypothetical protein
MQLVKGEVELEGDIMAVVSVCLDLSFCFVLQHDGCIL